MECGDIGAVVFLPWAGFILFSELSSYIVIGSQGDRTDKRDTSAFNTWKDIIIPGNVDDGMTKEGATVLQPLPLSSRKYLANFLGRAQGKTGRLQLIELAKKYPDKLFALLPTTLFVLDSDVAVTLF
ncbi:N-terminal Xaa-Pro-Lys N-methyltransferase 1 [Bienertia sinuspersici]